MDVSKITGHLVLIIGPTGSGKGSLIRHLRQVFPDITYKISCTTRAPRPGEVDGKDFYFLDRSTFEEKNASGDFLECAEYGGNLYGTLATELESGLYEGKIVVAEIEIQGVEQLKKIIPKEYLTIIYLDAGEWDVIKARVLKRAPITEEELTLRYQRYLKERTSIALADEVIENGDGQLEKANACVEKIIKNIMEHKAHAN